MLTCVDMIHTCTRAYMRTGISYSTRRPRLTPRLSSRGVHAWMHACMHICMHVCMYMPDASFVKQRSAPDASFGSSAKCMLAYMHACIHACMHTCIHQLRARCLLWQLRQAEALSIASSSEFRPWGAQHGCAHRSYAGARGTLELAWFGLI